MGFDGKLNELWVLRSKYQFLQVSEFSDMSMS